MISGGGEEEVSIIETKLFLQNLENISLGIKNNKKKIIRRASKETTKNYKCLLCFDDKVYLKSNLLKHIRTKHELVI